MTITAEVVPLKDNRVRLDVAVPKGEVDKKMDRTVRRLGREIRVPGFRPGKVPANVVYQRFGRDAIIDQMLRDSLAEWYSQVVTDTGIRPIEDPDVELPEDPPGDDGFTFTATVQLRPKATLGAYSGLDVAKGEAEVDPEALQTEIDRLREMVARLEPVERAAAKGDFVTLDFDGTVDGEPLASASARDYLVEIGGARLVGGFSDRLPGMAAGDTKTFPVDYPEADGRSELSGKTVKYTVTVKGVQAKILPEVDDALATQVSEFETMAELQADVERLLLEQAQAEVDELFRRAVIDAAVATAKVDVPELMTRIRIDAILQETANRLPQGMTFADYLRATNRTLDDARAALAPDAEMAIKRELVVEAVAETESIAVTDEEVEAQVRTDALAAGRDSETLLAELRKTDGGVETLRNDMVMRKAVDFLIESMNAIPVGLAEARERIWTPEAPKAPEGGLWTPDQPKPKTKTTKGPK